MSAATSAKLPRDEHRERHFPMVAMTTYALSPDGHVRVVSQFSQCIFSALPLLNAVSSSELEEQSALARRRAPKPRFHGLSSGHECRRDVYGNVTKPAVRV